MRVIFINGTETVNNYIQAFRSLTNTMGESFDKIRGVYFKFLGINAY